MGGVWEIEPTPTQQEQERVKMPISLILFIGSKLNSNMHRMNIVTEFFQQGCKPEGKILVQLDLH